MDGGGGSGGGIFKVKHGSDAAEVTNVHETGAGAVGDAVGERDIRVKSNTKIANMGMREFLQSEKRNRSLAYESHLHHVDRKTEKSLGDDALMVLVMV